MSEIPAELIDLVLDNIPWDGKDSEELWIEKPKPSQHLAQYSCVSRAWQASVEKRIFEEMRITTSELEEFAALFVGANIARRVFLKTLTVEIVLPSWPDEDVSYNPMALIPHLVADRVAFGLLVNRILAMLATIEVGKMEKPLLNLCLRDTAHCAIQLPIPEMRDRYGEPGEDFDADLEDGDEDRLTKFKEELQEAMDVRSRSETMKPVQPAMEGMTELRTNNSQFQVDSKPIAMLGSIKGFPDLKTLNLNTHDHYHLGRFVRYAHRECM